MSRRTIGCAVSALTVLVLAASSASAQAATLVLPGGACGLAGAATPYGIAGLAPNSSYSVLANGATVDSGTANAGGGAVGTFSVAGLDTAEKAYTVQVSDGTSVVATAAITMTSHDVDLKPLGGKPNRRVKIHLYGWLGHRVYLHFIPPHKKTASRTIKLGKTKGVCGRATVKLKHLYNTARPKAGSWTIAFDTHKRFEKTDPLLYEFSSLIF